ncbi:MAG TPA: copper amine oxidase N-terminal domain-containing protein [Symbiobacteriaceae bacterium]|jgi:hypothetical protein
MRRLIAFLLTVLLASCALPALARATAPTVLVDGKAVDAEGTVWVNGVRLIPVKAVVEALGGQMTWDADTFTALVTVGDLTIQLRVGTLEAIVNGERVVLFAPVVLKDGELYVPAGFLLATFGNRLAVTDPLLMNAIALNLLDPARQATLRNYDFTFDQHVEVQFQDQMIPFDAHARLRIRDKEAIQIMDLGVSGRPGTAISVVRAGGVVTNTGSGWQRSAIPAMNLPALGLKTRDGLYPYIREAHLGETRLGEGQLQQDVVITFDGSALQPLMEALAKAVLPAAAGLKLTPTWDQVTATYTIDLVAGYVVRQVIDASANVTAAGGPFQQNFRLRLHQVTTFTPNNDEIVWPADLPM